MPSLNEQRNSFVRSQQCFTFTIRQATSIRREPSLAFGIRAGGGMAGLTVHCSTFWALLCTRTPRAERRSLAEEDTTIDNSFLASFDLVGCPACAAPVEVVDRYVLESTDGPIEHATILCVE